MYSYRPKMEKFVTSCDFWETILSRLSDRVNWYDCLHGSTDLVVVKREWYAFNRFNLHLYDRIKTPVTRQTFRIIYGNIIATKVYLSRRRVAIPAVRIVHYALRRFRIYRICPVPSREPPESPETLNIFHVLSFKKLQLFEKQPIKHPFMEFLN